MQKILLVGSSNYYLREKQALKEIVTFSEHVLQYSTFPTTSSTMGNQFRHKVSLRKTVSQKNTSPWLKRRQKKIQKLQ